MCTHEHSLLRTRLFALLQPDDYAADQRPGEFLRVIAGYQWVITRLAIALTPVHSGLMKTGWRWRSQSTAATALCFFGLMASLHAGPLYIIALAENIAGVDASVHGHQRVSGLNASAEPAKAVVLDPEDEHFTGSTFLTLFGLGLLSFGLIPYLTVPVRRRSEGWNRSPVSDFPKTE